VYVKGAGLAQTKRQKIKPERLMIVTFAQAKDGPERSIPPVTCSFKSCKREHAASQEEVSQFRKKIKEVDPQFPLSNLLLTRNDLIEVKGVPLGHVNGKSVLDYQLRNFSYKDEEE
jgi:hypothetical protein